MRSRTDIKKEIPVRFNGMTGEDIQKQGHRRPNYEKESDEPRGDSEWEIDMEDAIDK